MRKSSKILAGTCAAMTLIGAAKVSAQEVQDSFFIREGDFSMASQYMLPLPKDTPTSIDSLLRGPNTTNIYAVDPIIGLNNRIKSVSSSERSKEFRTEEERKLLAERYQSFISQILKEKRSPDYGKSLVRLTDAVKDGIVNPQELEGVEDGVYMVVKEGRANGCNNPYTVFALVRVSKDGSARCIDDIIIYNEDDKKREDKKIAQEVEEDLKRKDAENKFPLPIAPKEAPAKSAKEEKDYRGVSLITQATSNFGLDSYSASIGARWNPFRKANVGFGATLDLGVALNKLVEEYSAPLSAGRTAYGTVTNIDQSSIGLSLETQLGLLQYLDIIAGVGLESHKGISQTNEEILSPEGETLKSSVNSVPNRQVFGKVYSGVEIPIGKKFKLKAFGGYNGKNGGYFGAGGTIKLK